MLTATHTTELEDHSGYNGSRFDTSTKLPRRMNMADVMNLNRIFPINIHKYSSSRSPIDISHFAKRQSAILLQQSVPKAEASKQPTQVI